MPPRGCKAWRGEIPPRRVCSCTAKRTDKPAFSVQYHPEASPGPTDSHYLFDRFVDMIDKSKGKK